MKSKKINLQYDEHVKAYYKFKKENKEKEKHPISLKNQEKGK